MSYLENLLRQAEPLEGHERGDLERWLAALKEDCEMFGEAAEDTARMARIRRRIGAPASDPAQRDGEEA